MVHKLGTIMHWRLESWIKIKSTFCRTHTGKSQLFHAFIYVNYVIYFVLMLEKQGNERTDRLFC